MRIFLVLVLFILTSLVPVVGNAQANSLQSGLMGYWKFDGIGTAYSIADESGNGNIGTVGTSSRLVNGKFGKALQFDVGGRWQHMTTGKSFSAQTWSVSAWVNPDRPIINTAPYHGNITIFSGQPDMISIRNDSVMLFRTKIADYDFAGNAGWRHVVVTFNGGTLTAYVDGAKRGSIATTTNVMASSAIRYIGTNGQANYGHVFTGAIDEVRLYNRAVTDEEVATLFSGQTTSNQTTPTAPAAPASVAGAPVATPSNIPQPPTSRFTNNLTITTDKTTYKLGENMTITATFTPAAEWVTYLRSIGTTQGEIKFLLKDPQSRMVHEKTFAFDLVANQVRQQYVWTTPTNNSFAGMSFSLETSVYDARKTTTVTEKKENLTFEVLPITTIPISSKVITSRLPAGVSPYLFGKILAERDATNDFTTSVPVTYTKPASGNSITTWLTVKNGSIDLSAYNGAHFVIENRSDKEVQLNILPYNAGSSDSQHAIWSAFTVPANSGLKHVLVSLVDPETTIFRCDQQNGMQRCPLGPDQIPADPQTMSRTLNRATFSRFQIRIAGLSTGDSLVVHSVKNVNISYRPENMVGYIDRWGQNNWVTFDGKITSDQQLKAIAASEGSALKPLPANWDAQGGDTRYGGYTATGFFRTEKIDGKWWLVSPQGNLFYAKGLNWVTHRTWGTTMRNRAQMVVGMPTASENTIFSNAYQNSTCQPNNNNISGTGEFCGGNQWLPYFSNLILKYHNGTDPIANVIGRWGNITRNRIYDWGFNSVKTTGVAPQGFKTAYTLVPLISSRPGVTRISGTNMPEIFSPTYKTSVDTFMQMFATTWNGRTAPTDPFNIGIASDNELDFGRGTNYNSPRDTYYLIIRVLSLNGDTTPTKAAFTRKLQEKYGSVSGLKAAWSLSLNDINTWDDFRVKPVVIAGGSFTTGLSADLSMLLRYYADEYYKIAREVTKKYFPNHLYLGSRFAQFFRAPNEVLDSCAQYCDVISINYYEHDLKESDWRYLLSKDKPILITEFHIGNLSRGGAFGGHHWVVGDEETGAKFEQYVRSALAKPQIVGYFYHSYVDMPLSGIDFESENMYASFVTTSDQPKTAMVNVAKNINSRVFSLRNARANNGTPPPPTQYKLTVNKSGVGTVTGSGINCGTDCDETVAEGTSITLTATVTGDNRFLGWSGACINTSGTCTVVVREEDSVTANFASTVANPDEDGDGVLNAQDLCAGTPIAFKSIVNRQGCILPRLNLFDIKTNLGTVTNLNSVTDFQVGKTNIGKVQFTQPVSVTRNNGQIDLDANLLITAKRVEMKSNIIPELNKPATITLYGITERNPKILRNGVECPPTICVVKSFTNGVLTFTVNGF